MNYHNNLWDSHFFILVRHVQFFKDVSAHCRSDASVLSKTELNAAPDHPNQHELFMKPSNPAFPAVIYYKVCRELCATLAEKFPLS